MTALFKILYLNKIKMLKLTIKAKKNVDIAPPIKPSTVFFGDSSIN